VVLNHEVRPIGDPALLQWFGHEGILVDILRRVRSHFIIHAGVVVRDDVAFVLLGESTYGKTTLVLELVRRGFRFLSDDLAALSRQNNQVDLFPRSPRIRQGTLDLLDLPTPRDVSARWMDKLIVDVERLFPGSLGEPAPLQYVISLYDSKAKPLAERDRQPLRVWLERVPPDLLDHLEGHQYVAHYAVERWHGLPRLVIHTPQKHALLSEIETICQEQQVPILNVWRRAEHQPLFTGPVEMQRITPIQVLPDLMQQFQPGPQSAILQEFHNQPAQFMLELANRIAPAHCYRLHVGPLRQMADQICALLD
jgi:hypothetical protein